MGEAIRRIWGDDGGSETVSKAEIKPKQKYILENDEVKRIPEEILTTKGDGIEFL